MSRATVEISTGMRILTNRGVAIVVEVDRHGAHLKDSTGHTHFTAFTELDAREVSDSGVQLLHSSLLPWFIQLPADVQATALFRLQCILEVRTGYREGLAELAQPGEPFWPFGETYGVSITKRYEHMSRLVSFERTVDRTGTRHRPHRVATIDGDELEWVLDEGRRVIKAVEARKPGSAHDVSKALHAELNQHSSN